MYWSGLFNGCGNTCPFSSIITTCRISQRNSFTYNLSRYVCKYVSMYVYICMYVCMMYVCVYVCMYVCIYVYIYIYIYMYVCMMYVCVYVCMYIYMYVCMMYVYVCMYVCMYVCIFICISIFFSTTFPINLYICRLTDSDDPVRTQHRNIGTIQTPSAELKKRKKDLTKDLKTHTLPSLNPLFTCIVVLPPG